MTFWLTKNYVLFSFIFLCTLRRVILLLARSSIQVFKPESLEPKNTLLQLLNQIWNMKKIRAMERTGGGVGISHSWISHALLKNPKTPEIWTIEGDTKKREKSKKCHSYNNNLALKTARISHSKTPNNTRRQPKTPKNNKNI